MKYPPRDAYRIRPPFEAPSPPPRPLFAFGLLAVGLGIAVFGAFHDVSSTTREPTTHMPPYSPLPTAGSFQLGPDIALGDPRPQPSQPSLALASPSPTAVVLHRQGSLPIPSAPAYVADRGQPAIAQPPPVQVWSSAAVLTPGVQVAAVEPPAVVPPPAAPPPPVVAPGVQPAVEPTPTPTPLPTATSQPTPTPTSTSSSTPTPQSSASPTPQPSATAGSQGNCVPTKHHPCR